MDIINNIGSLRQDLRNNGWHMTAFLFNYKHTEYDVLFEDLDNLTKKNDYAIAKLTFIDVNEPNRTYSAEVNQIKILHPDIRTFREFFGIEYSENLGDILKQFFDNFTSIVPPIAPQILNDRQNNEIDRCLAQYGNRDPNAIYCYDARRLGKRNEKQMHRSIFISNLTKRKKTDLFDYFKDEPTVTFYYSANPDDELRTNQILRNFSMRESKR